MEEWFYENLNELKKRLLLVLAALAITSIATFSLGVETISIDGVNLPYPNPNIENSLSVQFFEKLKSDLVPSEVQLIVTRPADALFLDLNISIFLGFLISLPFVVYQLARFLAPALTSREKRVIRKIFLLTVPLFVAGALFAYVVVIPISIGFLYSYVAAVGATPFLDINEFVTFVMQFVVGFGLVFTLPLIMYGLSSFGVKPDTWKRNWRYAVAGIVILGAVITPDGSLVTLAMVAGPMIALYFAGWAASRHAYAAYLGKPASSAKA